MDMPGSFPPHLVLATAHHLRNGERVGHGVDRVDLHDTLRGCRLGQDVLLVLGVHGVLKHHAGRVAGCLVKRTHRHGWGFGDHLHIGFE